ncbi:MAG: virulence-associated E family protein, partial [Clostridia bacterium]|nr:virulence-associated E family protein [Clostridia bacterium]
SSQWPVSSRQTKTVKTSIKKQSDPLKKEGIIGAFCRAYGISDAIEKFLDDVYKPSVMPDRYDYIPADSTAGVVVYDDKFAYSHHATDPVCGKLCNAWDLVRLHKYGDLDVNAEVNTPVSKLPSYIAMQQMALNDDNIKKQVLSEKKKQAEKDFKADDNWRNKLKIDKSGNAKNTLQNLILILENDEKLKGIVFNEFADGMEIKHKAPWKRPKDFSFWREADDAQLEAYIDKIYGSFSKRNYDTAIAKVVDDRSYHPVREYFKSLPAWDGKCRLDTLLINFFGSADTPYVRAATRKTFVGAVARIKRPGCKFDTMLVLNGFQGQKKSSLLRRLCGKWFNDDVSLSDTKDKTAAEKLQGSWIIEISELSGMRKADIETLKAFISRQNDIYRASYGRRASPHPRQCIFIATTNAENGFLRDITGNRRYWPVKTLKMYSKDPAELSDEFVNQFWAEAIYYYKKGEKLYIEDNSILKYAVQEQHDALESDEREGIVREYLDTLLPENWNSMDLFARRNFLNGSEFTGQNLVGKIRRKRVCNMEIWCECFGRERGQLKKMDANEITGIMARLDGWKKSDDKARFGMYGIVKGYERMEEKN